ncbi:hypothetical protein AcV5_000762 [Taiwanofungus camphoratus]|nr:hypothetical protein AcV5_000762 [Antrodia cinnamomea]
MQDQQTTAIVTERRHRGVEGKRVAIPASSTLATTSVEATDKPMQAIETANLLSFDVFFTSGNFAVTVRALNVTQAPIPAPSMTTPVTSEPPLTLDSPSGCAEWVSRLRAR